MILNPHPQSDGLLLCHNERGQISAGDAEILRQVAGKPVKGDLGFGLLLEQRLKGGQRGSIRRALPVAGLKVGNDGEFA